MTTMLTTRKNDAALFINEGTAIDIATGLSLRGFLANVAREYVDSATGRDLGFRVIAFNSDRSFAGFYAE